MSRAMMSQEAARRCSAAAEVLDGRGVRGACVRALGSDGEIASIRLPDAADPESLDRVLGAEAEMRALGFRFVTLDLDDAPEAR